MSSPQSNPRGYSESLATKMDRMADAMSNGRAALREDGVYVDVYANGHVRAVTIDDETAPRGTRLGTLITDLINKAREQAQMEVEDSVREVQADPRIARIIEQVGDAPERSLPAPGVADDPWEEDDDPFRRRSRIIAD